MPTGETDSYGWFVGIDWATTAHEVCIWATTRQAGEHHQVEHSGPGLAGFVDKLMKLCDGAVERVAVAIETPRGAVVESLLERGFHVYAINPKQLDRFRDRHTVAGAKDDRRDALVLADSLRTDRRSFRQVRLGDARLVQLREMSRLDDELVEDRNRLTNRLREQIHRYYPALLRLVPAADEPWLWALLELAPTPARGARLKPTRIAKLLSTHRIRRVTVEQVQAVLREAPLRVAPGAAEAAVAHIELLLPRLLVTVEQRATCQRALERLLDALTTGDDASGQKGEHRDVQILRSLAGVGKKVAATLLAEASQPLEDRDYHALRAHVGVAPVTKQSGKRKTVGMRRACNGRLRNAVYHWSRVAAVHDPRCAEAYQRARARGQSHGRALRGLADRLLRLLIAMLKTGTLFDAARWAPSTAAGAAEAIA